MPAILLSSVSATYRVPLKPRPTPVGPMTRAAGSVRAGKPDPIRLLASTRGVLQGALVMMSRSTVPPLGLVCWPRMPPSTLVTNSSAKLPRSRAVMSHGPSMPWPVIVFRTWPHWSRTIRQPGPEILPFWVGSEPTITQPLRSATRAVVRPTPPGHLVSLMPANSDMPPCGLTWTMVVPVPCALALSLKLLTRTSPRCRLPVLRGTTATP